MIKAGTRFTHSPTFAEHLDVLHSVNFLTTGGSIVQTPGVAPAGQLDIYGGGAAGRDLILHANTIDTGPVITMWGGSSIRMTAGTGGDIDAVLGDNIGANVFEVFDSDINAAWKVDSDGNVIVYGTTITHNVSGGGLSIAAGGLTINGGGATTETLTLFANATDSTPYIELTGLGTAVFASSVTDSDAFQFAAPSLTTGKGISVIVDTDNATDASCYSLMSGAAGTNEVFKVNELGLIKGYKTDGTSRWRRMQFKGANCMGSTLGITYGGENNAVAYHSMTATGHYLWVQFQVPPDWDGASDMDIRMRFILPLAQAANDDFQFQYDLVYGKPYDDVSNMHNQSNNFTYDVTTNNAQWTMHQQSFVLNWDFGGQVLASDDTIFIKLHPTVIGGAGKVDEIGITSVELWYQSIYPATPTL